jgi:demethylmenaquinone methyltransferase/2-methoxy-6-polyprenyl-1,4-benzoquinol methylase
MSAAPASVPDRALVERVFDSLADRYDFAVVVGTLGQDLRWKHALVRSVRPRPGERALDLACGTGLVVERLRRAVGRTGTVWGLDRNDPMLRGAVRRRGSGPWLRGTATALPVRTASVDIVTAAYLPKYVPREIWTAEVRRVLKPGGRFAAYDFAPPRRSALGRGYRGFVGWALPRLGRVVRSDAERWRELASFLRDAALGSPWESELAAALDRTGFVDVRWRVSLGGAVALVSARTPSVLELRANSAPTPQRV